LALRIGLAIRQVRRQGGNVVTVDRRSGWIAAAAIAVTVCVAMPALGSTSESKPASAAAACSDVTVPSTGPAAPEQTLTIKLIGSVTCAKAHELVTAFFTRVAAGDCADLGNRCIMEFPDDWTCSFITAGESEQIGGAGAGCVQGDPLKAAIRLFGAGTRPGRLHVDQFRSPNLKVWCGLSGLTASFCVTGGLTDGPQRAATIDRRGHVTTCHVRRPSFRASCTQDWNDAATPLVDGEQTEAHGVRCTAERNGITCVRTRGRGKGKGFFVSTTKTRRIR
jgi:hypothetical protein